MMRKIMKQGGLDMGEDRPQPIMSGSKSGGGGVRITNATIAPDLPQHVGRYPFRIEGDAPKGLKLDDLTGLMEARFRGDPKFNLRHSKDEAIQRLKDRMEKRLERIKVAEEKAASHATNLAEQKEKYDVTREEIEHEALADLDDKRDKIERDIAQAENEARSLRNQIVNLNSELVTTKNSVEDQRKVLEAGQDRVLSGMGTNAMDEPFITGDQATDMAADLLDHWRSRLQEYEGMPLASEFDELAGMLAKLLSKTVNRVNDRWRDSGRSEPAVAPQADPVAVIDRGDGSLF